MESSRKKGNQGAVDNTGVSVSTSRVRAWTFRQEAIAPCFVSDIFALQEDEGSHGDADFYWLGRVPCRVVRVVGLIVGIVQHDDNTRYSVDDGSGIIDCLQKHEKPPPTPKKHGKITKVTSVKSVEPRPPPPPIAEVGKAIRVEGRVARARGSKVLRVERGGIVVCGSANEEPQHWAEVVRLHERSYSLKEPFVIPLSKEPSTPQKPPRSQILSSSATSNLASSPVKDFSSPVKPPPSGNTTQPSSPPRLRHPSRLRTRELTDATFGHYVKHYIDSAPEFQFVPSSSPSPSTHESSPGGSSPEQIQRSFTVSYLRRVPLLANMAKSVVRAERKRREREARKPQELQNQRPSHSAFSKSSRVLKTSSEPTSRKMKRLFVQTILKLYTEGSIIIWSGPKCVHRPREEVSQHSFLWKNHSSTMTDISTQSTMISSVSQGDDSSAELSDEDSNEEAYIPVPKTFVAELVLDAMRKLSARNRKLQERSAEAGLRSTVHHPSTSEVTSYLHRTDERWANIGDWAVKEAIEHLVNLDYIYKAGNDRWALCM